MEKKMPNTKMMSNIMSNIELKNIFFSIGFFVVTILIIIFGTIYYFQKTEINREGYKVNASVVEIIYGYNSNGVETHTVCVSYDIDGKQYTEKSDVPYKSTMKIGDIVTIYYDKIDPTKITSGELMKKIPIIVGIAALFTLSSGIYFACKIKKKHTQFVEE
jgi:hypothetical protein